MRIRDYITISLYVSKRCYSEEEIADTFTLYRYLGIILHSTFRNANGKRSIKK